MFTGIIEDLGIINEIKPDSQAFRLKIKTTLPLSEVKKGDSIAVNGICLTVTDLTPDTGEFFCDAVRETAMRTTISEWSRGTKVNLERAMSANGRLDGHFVSGHVDATGRITGIVKTGIQNTLTVNFPNELKPFIAEKGSISIDGVSLTVAAVRGVTLEVAVIPFTFEHTVLSTKSIGSRVNLEVDMIARQIYHMLKTMGKI
ncbi:riboflavin synthase [Myxococcota bacterium]|nr:riboflavin synthase [Myxococcota bacterium]MBU1379960.1 riboflavin synthase [Myxococcota bacterium]MBU1496484.1 riboflavin synthase [Myxococcota bacterium]